jgi:AraC-like DNA-binding protein/DNA gyrase inhibitor GyrI
MEEILGYIEENINQPFHIQDTPAKNYISTMQLYRDFYSLTGHSVKEYIRKRRLSNALAMVKFSEKSLVDIAYEYGYSSQQAFCKCVKAATGLTPMEYKLGDSYYYYPRLCMEDKYQVAVCTENIPGTIHMKYYHSQIRGIENRSVAYLFSLIPSYEGRIFGKNGYQSGQKFCYELNIEYKEELIGLLKESDFRDITVAGPQACTYARLSVVNVEKNINEAWDYLYSKWLEASMFEQTEETYFEEYHYKDNKIKKLTLYLPVRKRRDYNKIAIKECENMYFLTASGEERKASQRVLEYLSSHNPYDIDKIDKFYVSVSNGIYTCGVMIDARYYEKIKNDNTIEKLHIAGGSFAILEGNLCGDGSVNETILDAWLLENGLRRDGLPCFTVYETFGSFEGKDIKTKSYSKLVQLSDTP